jgi:TrmH family RNA methyltransferase
MGHASDARVRFTVVLVRPQGPVNIGLASRACANLGIDDLRLVAPAVPVPCAESRMFAHHAGSLLAAARLFQDLPAAVADCDLVVGTTARRRRDALPFIAPEAIGAEAAGRGGGRVALVFGNEATGLSAGELQSCDLGVALQTPGPYPSYNLSHAVAITLYLAVATERAAPAAAVTPAGHGGEERLFQHWLGALEATGYFRRTSATRFAPKLRRLIGRLRISEHDLHTLWGMLAHWRGRPGA